MSGSRLERKKRRSEYRLLGLIGQGQFGQVYCAVHRRTKELVALKNLDRRRFPTRDFLREFSFLVTLRHPNIVACRAIAHVPAGRQMVMDYCEGGTLRDLLDGDVPLSLKQRLALVADMLAGLAHAHANGIVHCDLKPENVLLNVTPTGWTARLSDFGLARFSRELGGQSTTETGDSGSPAYMAPERFYGEFSAASDIYAIGVMLYELICGDRPFSGTYGDLMAAHLNQPVKVPDTVPIVLRSPIVTAMHKLPQARFASAADMLDAIHLALEVGEAIARDAKEPAPGESTSRPRRILVAQPALSVPAPIVQMAAAGDRLWLSFANTLQAFAVSVVGIEQTPARSLELAHSICSLRVCETGCVAVTQPERELTPEEEVLGVQLEADREVFWVARAATSEGDAPDRELRRIEVGRSRELFIALEPGGRWVCVANGDSQDIDRSLLDVDWMERVESDRADSSAAFRFEIYKLPEWERTRLVLEETFPVEVIALDRRHGLALFPADAIDDIEVSPQDITPEVNLRPTSARLFSRRSGWADSMPIPIAIERLTSSATHPLQALGLEKDAAEPTAVLLQVHPLRIQRVKLDEHPDVIAATAWGFLLAQRDGRVLALDEDGYHLGRGSVEVEGELHAIAPLSAYRIAIAHGTPARGQVSVIDLEEWILEATAAIEQA